MREHKKFKITRKVLEAMGACAEGVADVAKHLPLTISTDPEQNYAAALLLANGNRAHDDRTFDVRWFINALIVPWVDEPYTSTLTCDCEDAYIAAQYLAMAADVLDGGMPRDASSAASSARVALRNGRRR